MSELDKINVQDLTPDNIYQYIDEFNIYGYVYRIRNSINGKTYVGLRKISKDYTWHSYWGSGKLIKQSIAKNGRENFTKELLYVAFDHDELCDKEIEFILKEKANGHGEYNLFLSRWDSITNIPQHRDPAVVQAERITTYKKTAYKKYLQMINGKEQLILNTYKNEQNIIKTAKIVGLGKVIITRFLHENNVIMNNQNVIGHKMDNETKSKISKSLTKNLIIHTKTCQLQECLKEFTTTIKADKYCSIECKNIAKTIRFNKVRKTTEKRAVKKIYFNYCLYNKCDNYYSSTRKNDKYCSNDCKLAAAKTRKPGNSIILPDDPEIIRKLYWDDELSATKIAEQYNCNEQTIRNYMKKNDIPIRTFKESSRIVNQEANNTNLNMLCCLRYKRKFSLFNYKRHYEYCINATICATNKCKLPTKNSRSKYCWKH